MRGEGGGGGQLHTGGQGQTMQIHIRTARPLITFLTSRRGAGRLQVATVPLVFCWRPVVLAAAARNAGGSRACLMAHISSRKQYRLVQ